MTQAGLAKSSSERFHEIFIDDWYAQRTTLEERAPKSIAARLALSLGLDDQTMRYNHSGEGERIAQALDAFILDVSREGFAKATGLAGGNMGRLCDPLAVSGPMAHGINAIALMHFERVMASEMAPTEHTVFDYEGRRTMLAILPDGGARRGVEHDYAIMQLADATWWEGHELHVPLGSIPATLQVAAIGRPIGDVVSHSLINPTLIIADIDDGPGMTTITFRDDVKPKTWRESLASAL